jgi:membrane protease YdiL (CAAX protease family)
VPPADIGLTLHGAVRSALWGAGAAVILAPLVLGLNYGAVWLFRDVLGGTVYEHPLAVAGQHGLSAVEWLLLAFAVMVAAPLGEELVFRGALQRLFLELSANIVPWRGGQHAPPADSLGSAYPDAEAAYRRPANPHPAAAVFASALLFAAVHSFAWPSPIALFVLGLGLGYLALRTQSLVGPVILHSLFNAASFVLLIAGWTG